LRGKKKEEKKKKKAQASFQENRSGVGSGVHSDRECRVTDTKRGRKKTASFADWGGGGKNEPGVP